MNVLVIAPHPDDESIGCGGALCKHATQGDRVVVVYLTSGELGLKHLPREKAWQIREREARQAVKVLGLAEVIFLRGTDWFVGNEVRKLAGALSAILKREPPVLVYLPHPQEWHPDHKAALVVVQSALQQSGIPVPSLQGYEVWTPIAEYDHVEDISAMMPRKLQALRAHRSQLKAFSYERAVRGLNQYRGALAARCRYAEVFQTLNSQPAR
jgi:LmbE family N-acetylglucosaminyl deacetylase